MIKLVLSVLNKINPFALQHHPTMLSEKSREDALNIITDNGYEAYFWLPGVAHHNNKELWQALELLQKAGYVIIDEQGNLAGKVAKAHLSNNEKAETRRANFKLIESK